MDNETLQEFAERSYMQGCRAFIQHSNLVYVFPKVWGNNPFECLDSKKWHALRDYQDAERKKGVPIVHTTLADDNNWRMLRNRYRTPNRQIYFGSYLESQDTPEDGPRRPYIKLYTESGADLALFTNFCWRAGYPKGGQNG